LSDENIDRGPNRKISKLWDQIENNK